MALLDKEHALQLCEVISDHHDIGNQLLLGLMSGLVDVRLIRMRNRACPLLRDAWNTHHQNELLPGLAS